MLKHEPGMVEDDSYMAIPRLVETEPFPGCFPKNTPTSGWSHKTSKNLFFAEEFARVRGLQTTE
jgi:hypothetical protein